MVDLFSGYFVHILWSMSLITDVLFTSLYNSGLRDAVKNKKNPCLNFSALTHNSHEAHFTLLHSASWYLLFDPVTAQADVHTVKVQ